MSKKKVLVTGVGRHSLGEALVRNYVGRRPEAQLVGIDWEANPNLGDLTSFRRIVFDLNPLHCPGGLRGFAPALAETLAGTGSEGFECLVQSAGVYDFGSFLEHDVERRERVLGLNVLGVTEVAYAVMALNDRLGVRNDKQFTHVLVGSSHGLYARGGRPLYAPSKAYGVDLCTSLFDGQEVAKCIYVAAGPIDTPMLHRNHWVTKARGPEKFFNWVFSARPDKYRPIFVNCDETALDDAASEWRAAEKIRLRAAMSEYKAERSRAYSEDTGVLSPESCAAQMVDVILSDGSESGVYMLTIGSQPNVPSVKVVAFSKLDRSKCSS